MTRARLVSALLALALVFAAGSACAQEDSDKQVTPDSGFAWLDGDDDVPATVERKRVQKGVPRDGHPLDVIPAVDEPRFYASHEAAEKDLGLTADDRVLGIVIDGEARAYPTRILDRHEIVNDTIGEHAFAVVW